MFILNKMTTNINTKGMMDMTGGKNPLVTYAIMLLAKFTKQAEKTPEYEFLVQQLKIGKLSKQDFFTKKASLIKKIAGI